MKEVKVLQVSGNEDPAKLAKLLHEVYNQGYEIVSTVPSTTVLYILERSRSKSSVKGDE